MALAAAVAALSASAVWAGSSGGTGQVFNISTSGATALGAFTRADSVDTILNLGTSSLTIGGTTYTLDADGEKMGFKIKADGGTRDTWAYYYHATGSVEGILELADGYGLTTTSLRPYDATSANILFVNGNSFNATPTLNTATTPPTLTIDGISQKNGWIVGRNYRNTVNPSTSNLASTLPGDQIIPAGNQSTAGTVYGQDLPKIAWSDVPSFQAFANPGTASPNAKPLDDPGTIGVDESAGYGKARPQGNSNFQKLRDITAISGGQSNFRNDSLAVVPFAVVANPGTGLAKLTDTDVKWLHATGRLPNGANFNVLTRDPGSGTRNQGGNNVDLDPSWAWGERDRILPSGTQSYTVPDPDGNPITLYPGDEARPLNLLNGGSSSLLRIEDRVGPNVRFSDKTSGSSRLAPAVVASRMAIGAHLSSGDVRTQTDAYSDAYAKSKQVRVLAVDWTEQPGEVVAGFVQPKAEDVTEGRWQMWSYSQAVTVKDTVNPANIRPHDPATMNTQYNAAQEAVLAGEARKFLDNIINSAGTFPSLITDATPADGILKAGFIITQIMGTQKAYDGAPQSARTRSSAEEAIWNAWKADPNYGGTLNWADYATFENTVPGYASDGAGNYVSGAATQVKYDIYRKANTLATGSANADASIVINDRVVLIGDFNNDKVRDLADVPAMAKAYANPDVYLADSSVGGPAIVAAAQHPQSAVKSALNGGAGDLTGAAVPGKFGLIVLSDFNSDGNVNAADNNTVAVDRADVRWFLYGAAIDTTGFATAKAKREDGVRLGQLKKNQAIDTFNLTLQGFVGTLVNPATGLNYTQAEIDALKFNKFDVNNDGIVNREDAKIVDKFVGKSYKNLNDQLSATIPMTFAKHAADGGGTRTVDVAYNLVEAELNDSPDGGITHVLSAGTSDFKLMRTALGSALLDGDANIDGTVNFADLLVLSQNYNQSVDRWSKGDFNFDGTVNFGDLLSLSQNYNQSAPSAGASAVPEPSVLGLAAVASLGLLRRRRRA